MNKKFFIIQDTDIKLSTIEVADIEQRKTTVFKDSAENKLRLNKERLSKEDIQLRHTENRIIIKIDLDGKDIHTFEDGTQIYRGRRFNELNVRITDPVNAFVIDAEGIPKGAEILIHPNSIADANKIFGYESISEEQGNSIRYYSIETISAFLWRIGNDEWKPLKGFATALRVFEPYTGIIEGIPPKVLKNVLYITSGEYEGQVAHTLVSCDYEIIFINEKGIEERKIRCRHYENEEHDREELIAIDHDLTQKVKEGKLLIGLSETDSKQLKLK